MFQKEALLEIGLFGRTPETKASKSVALFSKSENAAEKLEDRFSQLKAEG